MKSDPNFRPERFEGATVREGELSGGLRFLLTNTTTGEYYGIDFFTRTIWNLLDGEHTLAQILAEAKARFGSIRKEGVKEEVLFLASEGLLAGTNKPPPERRRVRLVSAFEVDFQLVKDSVKLFSQLSRPVGLLFDGPGLWVVLIIVAVGALLLAPNFLPILYDKSNFLILGSPVVGWFFYFLLLFPEVVVHELCHGALLARYGGRPGEVGTGLFYFGPMFYVDTKDAWILPRMSRIKVSLSGPLSSLLLGSVFVMVGAVWGNQILRMMGFFCFYTMLYNLIPVIETDSYYVFADLLKVPNLRLEAFKYLGGILKRNPEPTIRDLSPVQKAGVLGFALSAPVFIALLAYDSYWPYQYMVVDTVAAVGRIIAGGEPTGQLAIDVAAVAYFSLMTVGFIILPISLINRRRNPPPPLPKIDAELQPGIPTRPCTTCSARIPTNAACCLKCGVQQPH